MTDFEAVRLYICCLRERQLMLVVEDPTLLPGIPNAFIRDGRVRPARVMVEIHQNFSMNDFISGEGECIRAGQSKCFHPDPKRLTPPKLKFDEMPRSRPF